MYECVVDKFQLKIIIKRKNYQTFDVVMEHKPHPMKQKYSACNQLKLYIQKRMKVDYLKSVNINLIIRMYNMLLQVEGEAVSFVPLTYSLF